MGRSRYNMERLKCRTEHGPRPKNNFKTSSRFITYPEKLVRDELSKMSLTPSTSGDHEMMTSHQDDISGSKTEEEDGLVVPWLLYDGIQLVVKALKYVESRKKDGLPMFHFQVEAAELGVHEIADLLKSLKRLPMDWKFDRALVSKYRPSRRPSEDEELEEEGEDDSESDEESEEEGEDDSALTDD